jgi:Icc-related predicted phosphoesterase
MGSIGRPIVRIASVSGSVTDRRHEFAEIAKHEDIQFIVGDWMSEYNMTSRGGAKVGGKEATSGSEYEQCFLESIVPALEHLARREIKVAVNAGASDTKRLHDDLVKIIEEKELNLKVAWIEGDEVLETVEKALKGGEDFRSLTTGK